MKKVFLLLLAAITIISCRTEDSIAEPEVQQVEAAAKVIGEWQNYRDEKEETVLDQWTGSAWTTKQEWYKTLRPNSQIILEFAADGTFKDKYGTVVTSTGVWAKLANGSYTFNYVQGANPNPALNGTRIMKFYCDNTYSVKVEGNEKSILYYKKIAETECGATVPYKVN
ncbi:hypothetical protein [Frigoriflavimonas asaccharolytica]|uniref:Lipocalin-like protein n=1 Tax=Frigoriflavimonas asaccharolytica TaxID=2735899 RepID=A0A8J8K7Z9_9FLAO|nr:hypothetical protein [Frigoriflavimonas asaccharolytica]NRS92041.1 hypothetical protein [Frigoriflavimonas asaccharolytica]